MKKNKQRIFVIGSVVLSCLVLAFIMFGSFFFRPGSEPTIRLGTTSSMENSGLSKILLKQFTQDTGIDVHHIVFGSGKIIKLAQTGDIDVLITHAKKLEETLIHSQNGIDRKEFMMNNFVILGQEQDRANISHAKNIQQVMQSIYNTQSLFVSRADESGTHQREKKLWQNIALNSNDFPSSWYVKTGQGMGNSIMIAQQKRAYIMSDLATWYAYKNKTNLKILYKDSKELLNIYAITLVNPQKHRLKNAKYARLFYNWLLGPKGKEVINRFKIDGYQVFFTIP